MKMCIRDRLIFICSAKVSIEKFSSANCSAITPCIFAINSVSYTHLDVYKRQSVYRASMGAFSRSTNPLGNWDNMYDKIQSINLFMEKGVTDDVTVSYTHLDVYKRQSTCYLTVGMIQTMEDPQKLQQWHLKNGHSCLMQVH